MAEEREYLDPLAILADTYTLPDGYDSWGVKSIGFDGRTKQKFLWPNPGEQTGRFELDP